MLYTAMHGKQVTQADTLLVVSVDKPACRPALERLSLRCKVSLKLIRAMLIIGVTVWSKNRISTIPACASQGLPAATVITAPPDRRSS